MRDTSLSALTNQNERRCTVARLLTKDDIVFVARSKGWHGTRSAVKKEALLEWLAARGVSADQIPGLARIARQAAESGVAPEARVQAEGAVDAAEVRRLVAEALGNADTLKDIVQDAVQSMQPKKVVVDTATSKTVKLEKHTHPMFEKVLKLVAAGLNVLLVGPAGCGKTTLAEHIAEALDRKYGTLHCTSGASESQLTGWLLPVGVGGQFDYVPSEFVTLYEQGESVYLVDEIDAADPNMLLVINSALANGSLHVPQRYKKPHVKRGKNASIIAAANTYGTGADMMYAGRNQLDAATLDRFYVINMDYDAGLEKKIIGNDPKDVALGDWCLRLRDAVKQNRLRRVVSTRTIMKAITARRAGVPEAEIKADIMSGWKADELAKVTVY